MPLSDVSPAILREGRANIYRKLDYTPKLGQRRFDEAVDSGKRFVGMFAPPQDGKSFHTGKHVLPYLFTPDVHIWIVAPTYQDGSKEFGYIYQDLASLGVLRSARRKHFDIRGGNMHIELRNDSWVQVVSAENRENLRREQLDVVILAEASKLDENLYDRFLYARVEKRRGKVLVPTTHKGYGWVYEDFRLPGLSVKDKTWRWGEWRENEREKLGGEPNPDYDDEYWSCQISYVPEFGEIMHRGEYPPEVIERARKRLPSPMFAEQFGGEAASYAGLVYTFDPRFHECDPFKIPDAWTHIIGYDHGAGGGSDPTAIEFGSYNPDGTLYWWGEIYDEAQHSIQQRASMMRIKLGNKVPAAVMRGRDAKQAGEELRQAGFWSSYPTEMDVSARIIRTTELMQSHQWKILRGQVPHLRRQILNYEWDEKNPGKPRDGNDDCLDAAGYASLAQVGLPDTNAGVDLDTSPAAIAERIRRDRLWGRHARERREREEREEGRSLAHILNPDPLEEEGLFVEAWEP